MYHLKLIFFDALITVPLVSGECRNNSVLIHNAIYQYSPISQKKIVRGE
jgi:hypothetical protein